MLDSSQIFRKVSLERLSSPEQLDTLMRVISPRAWIALSAISGLLVIAIGWGIFGSVPTKVDGACILMRPGGVSEITTAGGGRVTDIAVSVGDLVKEGQMIARIERLDLMEQIKGTQAKQRELKAQEAKLKSLDAMSTRQQAAYFAETERNLNSHIKSGQERVQVLEKKIAVQGALLEQGLITQQALLATRMDFASAKQDVDNTRNEVLKLAMSRTDSQKQIQNELTSIRAQVSEADLNLSAQIRNMDEMARIYSPYDGRVLEIQAALNSLTGAGTPILTIEQNGKSVNALETRIYISPFNGKKVKTNMTVQISPSTVKREEYGVMLANVRTVARFPSTSQGMMRVLNNAGLVKELSSQNPPIEVVADLIPSATTVSGYAWSSPKGPDVSIESGTLCNATVTVETQRPISLVIPMLRAKLGI
ncbi:MAG: NHLP bacteriocin system secretion protein [Pseudomonadota bacterium]